MAVYCAACGNSLAADARFCSTCGKPVAEGAFAAPPLAVRGPLVRPLAGRKVAGVCQAFANHYGWDVTLTRVIAVLVTIAVFPLGLVAYLLFWVILPQELRPTVAVTHVNTTT